VGDAFGDIFGDVFGDGSVEEESTVRKIGK
jgi:hypothetical protein